MIIDFHTHAFPDTVAAKAIPALAKEGQVTAHTLGTVDSLLASMDRAGIQTSVICSIATRPAQFEAILAWSAAIQSQRLIPLPSIHPADPDAVAKVFMLKDQGFAGIKMHPYYQDFFLDDKQLNPLYEALSETGLLLVVHCGYDIAFPRVRRADPVRILALHQRFPTLRLITTHLGGWDNWQEVDELLLGKEIYMEISFSLAYLPAELATRMLNKHPTDYLLFGSDSPWDDQSAAIQRLKLLQLSEDRLNNILTKNAARLLT